MKTECGLIGTFINNPITKEDLWYSLSAIQHRGQDSYGFASIHSRSDNEMGFEVKIKKEKGLLPEVDALDLYGEKCADNENSIDSEKNGVLFLGHMRYSTNTSIENLDESIMECNIQPVEISKKYGIYIAHNGNLPNLKDNMRRLGLGQYYKNGMSDTYLFKVIWNNKFENKLKQEGKTCKLEDILEYLKYILLNVVGAYSCVMTFCEPLMNSRISITDKTGSCGSADGRTSISSAASDTSETSNTSENSDFSDSSSDDNIINKNKRKYYLLGFRDRYGYKPLSIGKIVSEQCNKNLSEGISSNSNVSKSLLVNYCFFSESVQLQDNKYLIRDVAPGEIWYSEMNNKPSLLGRISDKGRNELIKKENGFLCSLEAIYFMKKDALLFNSNTTVNNFRRRLGIELGKQDVNKLSLELNIINPNSYEYDARQILKKRIVLYMPESSYGIALGYSDILETGIRNNLISKVQNIRSFIESTTEAREGKLKRKFAFNDEEIAALGNSEIVLIDDTIVRGNSMRYVISELYKRNSELKIHVRIGSPRLIKGCSFGIDLYDDELIAAKEPDLAKWLGIASVEFLDINTLREIFEKYEMMNCQYCFGVSNKYNKKTLEW